MNAPHLNRKLVLEAPERVQDGMGGYGVTWRALGTLWAAIKPGAGREVSGVAVSIARVPYRIVVRAAPVGEEQRPLPDQRFRDGTRIFTIQAVSDSDPVRRYLTCHVVEEVAA